METMFTKMMKGGAIFSMIMIMSLSMSMAQTKATVRGRIFDESNKGYLPGAYVFLEGTQFQTVSEADGRYMFVGVPAGTYNLKVTYIGFEEYKDEITVPAAGGIITRDIPMKPSAETLAEITIKGNTFGTQKALNEQKESMTIKNVVSEEQIRSFPDLNTAEVLQRVPGVTIQRDMGEGRFVALRGTAPNMTNVTVDGEQLAISNGEKRVVELDVINATQLAGLEVTKVITPDMDGNAIGGSVNLRTRTAFDYGGTLLKASIGGGKTSLATGGNFRADADFAAVLGKRSKFGISLGANYYKTSRERQNNEHKWGDRKDINDNPIPFALRDTEIQRSQNTRDRLGLNARLEYRFNENNRIYVSGMYNFRWDFQHREKTRVRFDKGDYVSRTEVQDVRFLRTLHDRLETQEAANYMLGGENQIGALKLSYSFQLSNAFTHKDQGQLKPEFQLKKVDVNILDIDSKTPGWVVTNDVDVNDGNNYKFDVSDLKYENTNNTVTASRLDLELPLILGSNTGILKFGAKYRTNNKDRKDLRSTWKWRGNDDLLLSQFETSQDIIKIQNGKYTLGHPLDGNEFRDYFFANQGPDKFESTNREDVNLGEPYTAKEDITGIYAMTTQTYGRLMVLVGLRTEFTNLDYTGSELIFDRDSIISSTQKNIKRSYKKFFPNVQLRYRFNENGNLRLAYSTGIAMPNFFDAMPYKIVNLDKEEITQGNPSLNPTESDNFDLLVEQFFQGIGILSGGVFYKKLDQFIFRSRQDVDIDGTEWRITQYLNGAGADLLGIEINWQQQFTFLPGFLSGFGIYANYTFTNSSNIDLGPDTQREDIETLPFQMKHVGNLALTYENQRLTARLSANFSGKFIEEVGDDNNWDEWRDKATTLDFSAEYGILKTLRLFFQWNNITNEVRYNYIGVPSRAREHGVNGMDFNAGLKWSLH